MTRIVLNTILILVINLLIPSLSLAQTGTKQVRIGYLSTTSPEAAGTNYEALRAGLKELGYIEGRNTVFDARYAHGDRKRLSMFARELVEARVNVIVTTGNRATLAAKEASGKIPIVVGGAGDLVESGLVASLAQPGGNVTGSTRMSSELGGKRLDLLRETIPKLTRVAAIIATAQDKEELKQIESAATQLNIKVQATNVREVKELNSAFKQIAGEQPEAVVITHSGFTFARKDQLVGHAIKHRLPTMCEQSGWTDAGCLISYGPDLPDLYRRAAYYVDRILKGTKPADLPVERPTKFEFVINLNTAKKIGLTIPPNVLARADKVIR